MREQDLPRRAVAGAGGALLLALMATDPASAAVPATEPAPSCVVVYESWRYTQAENTCAGIVTVKVVHQDGAEGPCHTVRPGDVTTIGEGYLGRHGHLRHVAVCASPTSADGVAVAAAGELRRADEAVLPSDAM
ncbi:hypothetical protein [Streptomyces griseoflavus]|uniref:hypothetical protein n=1 Tax=Streptomyces griseoflavus TaxID=35619 RepID=UPI003D70F06B